MLISTNAIVHWHSSNRKYFVEKGYVFTNFKDSFLVKIEDLKVGSVSLVKVQCDFCDKVIEKRYSNYLKNRKNYSKDCCDDNDCIQRKKTESYLNKYGVSHHMHVEEVKEKIKKTNLVKYGVENVFANKDIKEKIAKVNIEKYGVDNPSKSDEIVEKIRQTFLNNYGMYPMQVDSIKEKMYATKVKNGTTNLNAIFPIINGVAASKTQVKLGDYLNGKINTYICGKFVDIYLEEHNMVIEYDGGGHTLDIKRNRISEQDFYLKEKLSEEKLINSGLKFVRIKNENDVAFSCEYIDREIKEFIKRDSNSLLIKIS